MNITSIFSSRFIFLCLLFFYSQTSIADFSKGGDAYKQGDFKTAAEEFLKVAEKGDHRAMYALGSMYAGGTGVEQSHKEAYKWFIRAAKYGRPDAQYKLGVMYDDGIGVKQNYKKAGKWYTQAAKSGYASAQHKLGLLYANGHGVTQNNIKAYAWLVVARQNIKGVMPMQEGEVSDEKLTQVEVDTVAKKKTMISSNLDSINQELEKIKQEMTPEQMEESKILAYEYSRYRRILNY